MISLINIVLPVFGIIFCGYLVNQSGVLTQQSSEVLNRFVYFVAFPALLFGVVSRTSPEQIFYWPFVWAWLGGLFITFVITAVVSKVLYGGRLGVLSMRCMNSTCASTAFLGIPLAVAAFGSEAAVPAILATTILAIVIVSVTIFLIEADRNLGDDSAVTAKVARDITISLLKNPLMIAVTAGVIWAVTIGWLPGAAVKFFDLVGAPAIPLSLFALGLFIAGQSLRDDIGEISVFTLIKLIVHPIATWLLIEWFFEMDPLWAAVTILLAALPPASTCFVIAQRFQVYVGQTSAITVVSTVVSVISVSIVLLLLGVR